MAEGKAGEAENARRDPLPKSESPTCVLAVPRSGEILFPVAPPCPPAAGMG